LEFSDLMYSHVLGEEKYLKLDAKSARETLAVPLVTRVFRNYAGEASFAVSDVFRPTEKKVGDFIYEINSVNNSQKHLKLAMEFKSVKFKSEFIEGTKIDDYISGYEEKCRLDLAECLKKFDTAGSSKPFLAINFEGRVNFKTRDRIKARIGKLAVVTFSDNGIDDLN
jgi:hypothetical protein